jgi:hypothetical protein
VQNYIFLLSLQKNNRKDDKEILEKTRSGGVSELRNYRIIGWLCAY